MDYPLRKESIITKYFEGESTNTLRIKSLQRWEDYDPLHQQGLYKTVHYDMVTDEIVLQLVNKPGPTSRRHNIPTSKTYSRARRHTSQRCPRPGRWSKESTLTSHRIASRTLYPDQMQKNGWKPTVRSIRALWFGTPWKWYTHQEEQRFWVP